MMLILETTADRKNIRKSVQSLQCLDLRQHYLLSIYAVTHQATLSCKTIGIPGLGVITSRY